MAILFVLSLMSVSVSVFAAALDPLPTQDLVLSIEEDRGYSGDHSTLCLVRVVNRGRSTLAGGDVGFEARAIREGHVAARQRGRFGLTLGPHETLETKVAFLGRFDRFEVVLSNEVSRGSGSGKGRGKKGSKGSKGKSGGPSKSRRRAGLSPPLQ